MLVLYRGVLLSVPREATLTILRGLSLAPTLPSPQSLQDRGRGESFIFPFPGHAWVCWEASGLAQP